MSPEWGSLPLLPLRCVLDHLSTEDALAAMSTCCHWRNAVLLYEGHKDTLNLRMTNLDKNLFVTRIFRRHVRKLHIYVDCGEQELEKFMHFVLPRFFDTAKLQELIFIGPSYEQQSRVVSTAKLNRIITESLVFKHAHSLQKLGLMGCEMAAVKNDNDRYSHKLVEYFSRPLSFGGETAADAILSSANSSLMVFSAIQHIIVEYEQLNTRALETLGRLPRFEFVSLNIRARAALQPLDWARARRACTRALRAAVNIIAVPVKKFNEIIEIVLVEDLPLTSLKVLFCKALCAPLVSHVALQYRGALAELVWADAPREPAPPHPDCRLLNNSNYSDANPFVILCWQCTGLRRLVIHGYWVWHYDLVGMVRLGAALARLEVSCVFSRRDRFRARKHDTLHPLLAHHAPPTVHPDYVQEVNEFTKFKWEPAPHAQLHAALRSPSSPRDRADYALREAARPYHLTHE